MNSIFLADSLGYAIRTEFNAVLWWGLINGPQIPDYDASLYGWRIYSDEGVLPAAAIKS